MEEIIKILTPMNRCLISAGYDNAIEFIKHLVDLEVIEVPSRTEVGTWFVPDEWIIRDAYVADSKGQRIIDYKTEPLSLMVGSVSLNSFVDREELVKHLHYSDEQPNAVPYTYNLYGDKWGFNVRKSQFLTKNDEVLSGVKLENGKEWIPEMKWNLPEDRYEVVIDSEYKKGIMKIGVHTIKGKSDREILLFAHLDHPFQANDNLSAVACLLDLANKIKCEHTVKIIFCPETIGSITYALTQDISKVDFVVSLETLGGMGELMLQQSFAPSKINDAMYLALRGSGESFKLAKFKNLIGSDEYVFNDPNIGIPGIMLSRFPYPEYHTSADTPETINYGQIEKVGKAILKAIEIYEKDFVPVKLFKGPLMRSRYGCQQETHQANLAYDYFIYSMIGEKRLTELCVQYTLDFDIIYQLMLKLEKDGKICRADVGKRKIKKTAGKKH